MLLESLGQLIVKPPSHQWLKQASVFIEEPSDDDEPDLMPVDEETGAPDAVNVSGDETFTEGEDVQDEDEGEEHGEDQEGDDDDDPVVLSYDLIINNTLNEM